MAVALWAQSNAATAQRKPSATTTSTDFGGFGDEDESMAAPLTDEKHVCLCANLVDLTDVSCLVNCKGLKGGCSQA
jgi:hypothetical protein